MIMPPPRPTRSLLCVRHVQLVRRGEVELEGVTSQVVHSGPGAANTVVKLFKQVCVFTTILAHNKRVPTLVASRSSLLPPALRAFHSTHARTRTRA